MGVKQHLSWKSHQNGLGKGGGVSKKKGFASSIPYGEGGEVGEWVGFCIRPEEVLMFEADRPIKRNLKANIF